MAGEAAGGYVRRSRQLAQGGEATSAGGAIYDKEVLPDINAIRGADIVWLQVNALSHNNYYRIVDTARKNNILVRYFGSASAQKCAVQMVLDKLHTD